MKICWFSLIFLISILYSVPINGDTYHYQVIRKMCSAGKYHDPMTNRCKSVPGGGEMIKINLDARCTGGFEGLLAHSKKSRFYFVCNKNGVLTCMCGPKEHFNRIKLKCERKCHKDEGFTHGVVDHIMEKYKCAVMNGVYEENHCVLTSDTTTINPLKCNENFNHDNITRLQNILRYLTFLRTVHTLTSKSQEESTETVSTIPPQIFTFTSNTEIPTNSIESTTQTINPKSFVDIEEELKVFNKNWNLDTTTVPSTLLTTELTEVSGRSVDDETTTASPTTSTTEESTTITTTAESTAITTTEPTEEVTLRSELMETTTEMITTTTDFDVDAETLLPTIKPRSLAKRVKTKTTTEEPDITDEPEFEEYFEYFYEDDPDNVIKKSDPTKKKVSQGVMGRAFDDEEEDDWMMIVTVTEEFPVDFETTTTEMSTTDLPTTTELTTTTEPRDSTVEMAPEPLIRMFPGDLNFNDFEYFGKPKSMTTEQTTESTSTIFDSTTTEISSRTNSFIDSTTTEYSETSTESAGTTTGNYGTTTGSAGTTTESPATTTENAAQETSTTLEQTTTQIQDATNINILGGRFLNFWTENYDTTTGVTTMEPISTTEYTTTEQFESTTELVEPTTESAATTTEHIESRFDDFTAGDETTSTTQIPTSTLSNEESTVFTTTESISTTDDVTTTMDIFTTTVEEDQTDNVKLRLEDEKDTTTLPPTTTDAQTLTTQPNALLITTISPIEVVSNSTPPQTELNSKNEDGDLTTDVILQAEPEAIPTKLPYSSGVKKLKEGREYEYYYEYEEYAVDENGFEVKNPDMIKNESKLRIVKKQRRDNSEEYYAESISASKEREKDEYFL